LNERSCIAAALGVTKLTTIAVMRLVPLFVLIKFYFYDQPNWLAGWLAGIFGLKQDKDNKVGPASQQ